MNGLESSGDEFVGGSLSQATQRFNMAAPLESISFHSCGKEDEILSVGPAFDDENTALISQATQGVKKYGLSDQKLLQSWSLRQGIRLTGPTTTSSFTKSHYCIQNHKVIRIFSNKDSALEKGRKLQVDQKIFKVIPISHIYSAIIFCDGGISLLQLDSMQISKICEVEDKQIVHFADALAIEELTYLCTVRQTEEVYSLKWIVFDGKDTKEHDINLQSSGTTLLSGCLQIDKLDVNFVSLWNDGSLQTLCITDRKRIVALNNIPFVTSHTSIASIALNKIAVSGIRLDTGASIGVGVWDTKFGTLQQWSPLEFDSLDINKNSKFKIFCLNEHLFVTYKGEMCVYKVVPIDSTLRSSLSKFPGNKQVAEYHWDFNNERIDNKYHSIISLIEEVTNTNQKSKAEKCLHDLVKEAKSVNCDSDIIAIVGNFHDLWMKITKNDHLWNEDAIMDLLKLKLVPISCMVELFESITKKKMTELLKVAVLELKDSCVPENCVVIALQYFVRLLDQSIFDEKENTDLDNFSADFQDLQEFSFLNILLTSPFNDVFLMNSLRSMPFSDALILLKYLHYLLQFGVKPPSTLTSTPSILMVVRWTSLVLDAHFSQFILSVDARKILVELHQLVEAQVGFYKELVIVEVLLQQLKKSSAIPTKGNTGLYNIHVLHVR